MRSEATRTLKASGRRRPMDQNVEAPARNSPPSMNAPQDRLRAIDRTGAAAASIIEVVPDRRTGRRIERHRARSHRVASRPAAAFQVATADGDFTGNLVSVPHIAHGNRSEFRRAVTGIEAEYDGEAVARLESPEGAEHAMFLFWREGN